MAWFEANYTIQVLESQIPLLLIYENNSAVNVWTPCCWILSNCGGVVLTGLLVIALVQELVSLVDEFAGSCTVENVARRAHLNRAPSENDHYDHYVFSLQRGATVFLHAEAASQKITKSTGRRMFSPYGRLTRQVAIADK